MKKPIFKILILFFGLIFLNISYSQDQNKDQRTLVIIAPKKADLENYEEIAKKDGANYIQPLGLSGAVKANLSNETIKKLRKIGTYDIYQEIQGLTPN